MTDDSVNFFGLEIELWRIGDSPPAPKFNMVVEPNEGTKALPGGKGELTETAQLYRDYWTTFREDLADSKSPIRMGEPPPQSWMTFWGVGAGDLDMNPVRAGVVQRRRAGRLKPT